MDGDARPYRLYDPERPRTLQESISRPERAGCCESQNAKWAAILQRVEDQHGSDGEKSENRKRIHLCGCVSGTGPDGNSKLDR
jgi:hypothetical protein